MTVFCESFDFAKEARELLGPDWHCWSNSTDRLFRVGVGGAGRSKRVFGIGETQAEALRQASDLIRGRQWHEVEVRELPE